MSVKSKIFFAFLFIYAIVFYQENSSQKVLKANSVLIMPFIENEKYPYASDEIRYSLITGFLQKGYKVIEDDSVWAELINMDYNLSNISTEIADTISKYVNADLIIFGRINENVFTRETSLSHNRIVYKPVLIKVFDTRSKSLIFFERINLIEYWGMFENITEVHEIGLKIATTLRNRGY